MTSVHKIKVLHAIGNLGMGGAEVQCLRLANSLDPVSFDVSIAYFNEDTSAYVASNVKLYQIDRGSRINLLHVYRQLKETIEDLRPDVVHVWLPEVISVPCTLVSYRLGIPVISGHRKTLNYSGSISELIRDRLRSLQYFLANRIVSNFEIEEEPVMFKWLYRKKRGCVIANGLDIRALRGLEGKSLPNQAAYQLIYAGRLVPQKGIPTALRALRELVKVNSDVHLTIFGEGPDDYVAKLLLMVNQYGIYEKVTFFGGCRNWHAYATHAHALIFPTKGEGTSNTILEALAVGLPVIVSDIQMSRAMLYHEGTALVVKSGNPRAWALEMQKLLKKSCLRRSVARNGRLLADSFSMENMTTSYAILYRELHQLE